MRPVKSYENSFTTSADLKSKAINIKRLLGGLKNIDTGMLELDEKESKQLAGAISFVSSVGEHYEKASRVRRDAERAEAIENAKIDKLIKESQFARLTSVGEKVALISNGSNFMLESADSDSWSAKYLLGNTFEKYLQGMTYSVASAAKRTSTSYKEVLDEAWTKFQEILPERLKHYAGLIERIEKVLAEDSKAK